MRRAIWRLLQMARYLAIGGAEHLVVRGDVAGATIPCQRRHRVALDLIDDGAGAAGSGILGVAGERAVQRPQRLARLAQREVHLAQHALHGERTRMARHELLAQRQRAVRSPRGDLRLDTTQALTQRRLPHTSSRFMPPGASRRGPRNC